MPCRPLAPLLYRLHIWLPRYLPVPPGPGHGIHGRLAHRNRPPLLHGLHCFRIFRYFQAEEGLREEGGGLRRTNRREQAAVVGWDSLRQKQVLTTKKPIVRFSQTVAMNLRFERNHPGTNAMRKIHRGFLESAGRQNSCDHLYALPHSTDASWLPHCMDLHACMQMFALTESACSCWVGQSIQGVPKNTMHWKTSVEKLQLQTYFT